MNNAAAVTVSGQCIDSARLFAGCLADLIINPILLLIFVAGLVVFIYGIVEFVWGLSANGEEKEKGKQHMLYGLIGMFIMAAAFSIIKIIANTIGVSVPH
ncbi:MAG TPA: hypothetical protein VHD55_00515 [Candidatus Paceibacterota bacterium]|nr:hypothetical protein [Candidatus Paceibacterota bacterium]